MSFHRAPLRLPRRALVRRPPARSPFSLDGISDFFSQGATALPATPAPGTVDEEVALLRRIAAQNDRFVDSEVRFRWLQIGAIVAIPLFGGMWKWLLGRNRSSS